MNTKTVFSAPPASSADLWIRPPGTREEAGSDADAPPVIELSSKNLAAEDLSHRLDRADHVWKRRRLYRALRRLFRCAASREYLNGSGFIFAPHYWFVPGFTRDQDEDRLNFEDSSEGIIGPTYGRLLGVRLRRYLRELFDSLEVDLIFIEDGVGYRGFKRVLAVLFEIYDIHGGQARIEERHAVELDQETLGEFLRRLEKAGLLETAPPGQGAPPYVPPGWASHVLS